MRLNEGANTTASVCGSSVPQPLHVADDGSGALWGSDWREQVHQQVRTELLSADFIVLNCVLLKSFPGILEQRSATYTGKEK